MYILIKPIVILLIGALKVRYKMSSSSLEGHNYSHDVLLMPSKAAMRGRAEDTLTRTYMRFGETPLPSAAPGITSVQGKAVLATAPVWRRHKLLHTVSQPWRQNVFLHRGKQTRDDSECHLCWGTKERPWPRVRSSGRHYENEYCRGLELETQGTVDTLLKEIQSLYT